MGKFTPLQNNYFSLKRPLNATLSVSCVMIFSKSFVFFSQGVGVEDLKIQQIVLIVGPSCPITGERQTQFLLSNKRPKPFCSANQLIYNQTLTFYSHQHTEDCLNLNRTFFLQQKVFILIFGNHALQVLLTNRVTEGKVYTFVLKYKCKQVIESESYLFVNWLFDWS